MLKFLKTEESKGYFRMINLKPNLTLTHPLQWLCKMLALTTRNSIYTFIILCSFINAKALYGQTDTAQSGKFYREGLLKYKSEEYVDAIKDFESSIKYDSKNWNAYRESKC